MSGCENKEDFGEYSELIDDWCQEFGMCWVNSDFKVLFDRIKQMEVNEVKE